MELSCFFDHSRAGGVDNPVDLSYHPRRRNKLISENLIPESGEGVRWWILIRPDRYPAPWCTHCDLKQLWIRWPDRDRYLSFLWRNMAQKASVCTFSAISGVNNVPCPVFSMQKKVCQQVQEIVVRRSSFIMLCNMNSSPLAWQNFILAGKTGQKPGNTAIFTPPAILDVHQF